MPRPKGSSPKSYKKIFNALIDGPKSFSDIVNSTGLHRNTVASRLSILVNDDLLVKKDEGRRKIYEIPLSFKGDDDWLNKWVGYLSHKDIYEKSHIKANLFFLFNKEELIKRGKMASAFHELNDLGAFTEKESISFIKRASQKKIKLKPEHIINNINNPYCPECLLKKGKLVAPKTFKKPTHEIYQCIECGIEYTRDDLLEYDLKGKIKITHE